LQNLDALAAVAAQPYADDQRAMPVQHETQPDADDQRAMPVQRETEMPELQQD
jgi:hypothetical protein